MPVVHFKSVVCCSSEDKLHPASHLLTESNKKWKCETAGLKSIYVILQLEKSTKISGIDIGNEHSAFVEVLVGKNGWPTEKFQNILLISSFMTPLESRNSEPTHRVRCFAKNALIPSVCDEKWDLLKVVCTQPFNKHVQYGLAFIKVHSADDEASLTTSSPALSSLSNPSAVDKPKCGTFLGLPPNNVFSQFRFREDSPDSDKESGSSSSLFSKWKQTKQQLSSNGNSEGNSALSPAAAIREASTSVSKLTKYATITPRIEPSPSAKKRDSHGHTPDSKNKNDSDKKEPNDRNRDSLLYDDDDINTSIPKLEKIISKDKERIERQREEQKPKKKTNSSGRDSSRKMEASTSKFKTFVDSDFEVDGKSNDDQKKIEENPATTGKLDTNVLITAVASPKVNETKMPSENKAKTPTPKTISNKRLSSSTETTKDRKNSPSAKRAKPLHYKPFSKLLEGVVFVISGIQNPDRADIRDKGLKMGAKYKPDWDGVCTHLICAFQNTPKYKQVQGHGKIVKKNWIIECFAQKKRLPWRRYALDPNEANAPESEDEILDLASKPFDNNRMHINSNDSSNEEEEEVLEMYDLKIPKSPAVVVSGSETDDNEVEALPGPSKVNDTKSDEEKAKKIEIDIYEMDTDEDIPTSAD